MNEVIWGINRKGLLTIVSHILGYKIKIVLCGHDFIRIIQKQFGSWYLLKPFGSCYRNRFFGFDLEIAAFLELSINFLDVEIIYIDFWQLRMIGGLQIVYADHGLIWE